MQDGLIVAVASGKGGTGKTTIATNLAWVAASRGHRVQYLDCDVEEPNGHLILKPAIAHTQAVTIDVPEVDQSRCTGCGDCGAICQFSAIVHLGDRNVLTFEQLCHACGGCIRVCPTGAIRPKAVEVGIVELGVAGDVAFAGGRLQIGSVRTPTVVRAVKQQIKPDHLAILDVAPGTSCPVVEAIKGVDFVLLVTEPTPFGLNDLKLAVELVRAMNLPFAAIVNRYGIGDEQVNRYCQAEDIDVVVNLPDDRRVARAYSSGEMIVDVLSDYRQYFHRIYEYLQGTKAKSHDERRLWIWGKNTA